MPELPEVETVRRDLERLFVGARLQELTVTGRRTVRRHPPGELASLEGRVLQKVGRHGKYLFLLWDDGRALVAHLRMSGQLVAVAGGGPLAAHTHAVFFFAGAGELRFVDPRTFGELFLVVGHERPPELAHLGPDALTITAPALRTALAGRRKAVKSVLVDQTALAGIGNIYADEICFAAGVRPDRPAGSLGRRRAEGLAVSARRVLAAAIEARGSTLPDQQYVDLQGRTGYFQLQHKVYGRRGQPCLSCGADVQRVRWGSQSAYMCSACQR